MSLDVYISAFHPKALNVVTIWQVFWLTPLFTAFPSRLRRDSGVKIKQHLMELTATGIASASD